MLFYIEDELLEKKKNLNLDNLSHNTLHNNENTENSSVIEVAEQFNPADYESIKTNYKLGPWHYR